MESIRPFARSAFEVLPFFETALRRLFASGHRADHEVGVSDVTDDLAKAPDFRRRLERVQILWHFLRCPREVHFDLFELRFHRLRHGVAALRKHGRRQEKGCGRNDDESS